MPKSTRELLKQHVETWRSASSELSLQRELELRNIDTRQAVRDLFGGGTLIKDAPRKMTSGLVEQQAWFAKLRNEQLKD